MQERLERPAVALGYPVIKGLITIYVILNSFSIFEIYYISLDRA